MKEKPSHGAQVRVVKPSYTKRAPQTAISIAVDTSYVISQGGRNISTGIYMFDNQLNNGSTGEGTLELSTLANAGDLIGFDVVPVNPNTGDTVVITGFNVSAGNVFGSQGYPIATDKPSYWIGQAVNAGSQTYQIQILVTSGGPRPTKYYVNWDPFIAAR
ncbi:AidA/PixA family protein [Sorangium sp. So ce296]|uniref:AidA/PixA family protein n=1 Tax=Sorangium sp. So ce296 TaxID=3133296 RepID=UPI003F6043BE